MTKETPLMFEEIQSRMHSIVNEFCQLYNDLNGSQMDIECGTLIEIRTDVGYVRYSRSLDNFTEMRTYLKTDKDVSEDLINTKSDEL